MQKYGTFSIIPEISTGNSMDYVGIELNSKQKVEGWKRERRERDRYVCMCRIKHNFI